MSKEKKGKGKPEKKREREILNPYFNPERYGLRAAEGIHRLVEGKWNETQYDITLARGEARIDNPDSFLGVLRDHSNGVFSEQYTELRRELWGEHTKTMEQRARIELEEIKNRIPGLAEQSRKPYYVLAPYNAAPDTIEVSVKNGKAKIDYSRNRKGLDKHLGATNYPLLAEIAGAGNHLGRMHQHPKAQKAFVERSLEIGDITSQKDLNDRYTITKATVFMGLVYLAKFAMESTHFEHHMARSQLLRLPGILHEVDTHYQKLSENSGSQRRRRQ